MAIQYKFYKLILVAYLYKETRGGTSLGDGESRVLESRQSVEWSGKMIRKTIENAVG